MFNLSWKIKKVFLGCLVLGYSAVSILLLQIPDNKFHIYFLDVGQGDSIFIKTPENHQILIDGGPQSFVIEQLGEILPFFDKSIDLVVLTHPHADHVDGLVEVLKRYEVENVLITGVYSEYAGYYEFLDQIRERGVNVFIADASEDFVFSNVFLDILYPFDEIVGEYFENLNNSSVVMRVLYDDIVILLSGDMEVEGEEALVSAGEILQADIFKAGHHGSKTASSFEFLDKVKPSVVVIQCGKDNKFGHPHEEVLRRFEQVGVEWIYRNDIDGLVEFVF